MTPDFYCHGDRFFSCCTIKHPVRTIKDPFTCLDLFHVCTKRLFFALQCNYSLEVSLHFGRQVKTLTCPIPGLLPEDNSEVSKTFYGPTQVRGHKLLANKCNVVLSKICYKSAL